MVHMVTCLSGVAGVRKGSVCAVLGGQWGDEGKGKLADVLAKKCVDRLDRWSRGTRPDV